MSNIDTQNDIQINMAGNKAYEKAYEKYGVEFVKYVVNSECQLFADSLECFDEYAEYEYMQDLIEQESPNDKRKVKLWI